MAMTYSSVSTLIPHIFQAALDYARETLFMPSLVANYTDQTGMNPRSFAEYPSSGTVWNSVAEATDIDAQGFNYTTLGTVTPKEVGYRIDLYDRRLMTDRGFNIEAAADVAREITYKILRQPEIDLIAHFSAFTGGTVWAGSAASTPGTLTWGNIMAARAMMEKNKIPGPYYAVVDPMHYHFLAKEANIAGLTNAAPLSIRDQFQAQYIVQQVQNDLFLFVSPNCGTAAANQYMGLFTRATLVLDIRQGLRIEQERDASARRTELVSNMFYGTGAIRPTWGVQLRGTVIATVNN